MTTKKLYLAPTVESEAIDLPEAWSCYAEFEGIDWSASTQIIHGADTGTFELYCEN